MKKTCYIGGIVQHKLGNKSGYGFKITFNTPAEAVKYKEQAEYIIQVDGYKLINKRGYHDKLL